jgi:hypothetical protein
MRRVWLAFTGEAGVHRREEDAASGYWFAMSKQSDAVSALLSDPAGSLSSNSRTLVLFATFQWIASKPAAGPSRALT